MSIVKGLDKYGVEVHARDAAPGEKYTCPTCGVDMYPRRRPSDKGDATFACAPNTKHGDPWCIYMSNQQHRLYDMVNFDAGKFFERALAPKRDTAGTPGSGISEPRERNRQIDGSDVQELVKQCRITSLKSMWDAGLHIMEPGTHLGGRKLIHTLVSSKGFAALHTNKVNGFRVFQARAERFDDKKHRYIRFACICKNNGAWERKRIVLDFEDPDEFTETVRLLFEYRKCDNETMKWECTHNWALVAGNWTDHGKRGCKGYCYGFKHPTACQHCFGLLTAKFTSARQIYASNEPDNIYVPKKDGGK